MSDRPDDLRGNGRSAGRPPHLFQALWLSPVAIAHAAGALISRYRDSLGTRAARTRGEWPFRGPAGGPHGGFTIPRPWKGQR
jgi:hypothetical protein